MAEENLDQDQTLDQSSAEEIENARALGWADKDEWRGDPEQWVDAKTFLERGTTVLPMLQKNLKKTMDQNASILARQSTLETQLRAANAALEALSSESEERATEDLEEKKAGLKAALVEASKDGDHERIAELNVEIADIIAEEKLAKQQKPAGGDKREQPREHPDLAAWRADNPDFMANPRKLALASAVAAEMRQDPRNAALVGRPFMDKVRDEVEKALGGTGPGHSRVSGGGGGRREEGGGGGGGSQGKSYADLPADAKAACDKMAPRVVGEGKKHKDVSSWRKAYCATYFKQG